MRSAGFTSTATRLASVSDLDDKISRGHEARSILGNPVFIDSLERLKKEIVEKWAACPARDTEGREWLWQHYQVALKFEETLVEVLNTGKIALQEREMSLADKARNFVRRIA